MWYYVGMNTLTKCVVTGAIVGGLVGVGVEYLPLATQKRIDANARTCDLRIENAVLREKAAGNAKVGNVDLQSAMMKKEYRDIYHAENNSACACEEVLDGFYYDLTK